MRILGIVACASLALSTAAIAKDPPEDKLVCKRVQDPETGSHFSSTRRVCMKQSEWKELEDGTERAMQQGRDRSSVEFNGPPGMSGTPR